MFCLKNAKQKAVFQKCARPETKPTGRKSQREKKPHDPHNSTSLPDHTNDNQHPHNLIADGASGPTG